MRRTKLAPLVSILAAFAVISYPLRTLEAQKIAGRWEVRYERELSDRHGSGTVIQAFTATMTIQQRGDSIVGKWQMLPLPGEPIAPPHELRGEARNDSAFVQLLPIVDEDASMLQNVAHDIAEFLRTHIHGIPSMHTVMKFQVRGDSLVGTVRDVSVDGAVETRPLPMTGVRAKP